MMQNILTSGGIYRIPLFLLPRNSEIHVLFSCLLDWLLVLGFGFEQPFETIFYSISGRLSERGMEKRNEG